MEMLIVSLIVLMAALYALRKLIPNKDSNVLGCSCSNKDVCSQALRRSEPCLGKNDSIVC